MKTELLDLVANRDEAVSCAGELLKNGGLVAVPTETVYGLAADAFNPIAVGNIFKAKGRPQDNPLIVHICDLSQLDNIVASVPDKAKILMESFWPGPLTLVMKKSGRVPDVVSAGLYTVAVRFPSSRDITDIIRSAGTPLAAPSANLSGKPSPTRAEHVINDMNGRIDAIAMGEGMCAVGLESTVVDVTGEIPVLLRPGGITAEMLTDAVGEIKISEGVLGELPKGEKASSPGMKYKHYAPSNNVVIVKSNYEAFKSFMNSLPRNSCTAMCARGEGDGINQNIVYCGSKDDSDYARELFDKLREIDGKDTGTVYARAPLTEGIGLAIYNRLIRAAGFEVITFEE